MTSMRRTILSSILFLFCFQCTSCVYFCSVKTFDSVFNIGHLIYFVRCGEVWTYDPTLNGDEGDLIRDYSPLITVRKIFKDWSPKEGHINAFSFHGLSCVHQEEDSRGKCSVSVNEWQYLTFLIANQNMYAFRYETEYERKDNVPQLDLAYWEMLDETRLPPFFPYIDEVSPQLTHFDRKKVEIKFVLFDSVHYYLFLALKHEDYYCITYMNMKQMLFNVEEWPVVNMERTRKQWMKANCFIGSMHGMFFLKDTAYIVGQVLTENRVYDDQVYKLLVSADGQSRVEFMTINIEVGNHTYEPQTVRRFFGCAAAKPPNILRKKRSLQQPIQTQRQQIERMVKRVANNVLIQIMVSLLVLVLVYKLLITRLGVQFPDTVYSNLF